MENSYRGKKVYLLTFSSILSSISTLGPEQELSVASIFISRPRADSQAIYSGFGWPSGVTAGGS